MIPSWSEFYFFSIDALYVTGIVVAEPSLDVFHTLLELAIYGLLCAILTHFFFCSAAVRYFQAVEPGHQFPAQHSLLVDGKRNVMSFGNRMSDRKASIAGLGLRPRNAVL
jgi:hypothetical protein